MGLETVVTRDFIVDNPTFVYYNRNQGLTRIGEGLLKLEFSDLTGVTCCQSETFWGCRQQCNSWRA
jgi:hypothetical protein